MNYRCISTIVFFLILIFNPLLWSNSYKGKRPSFELDYIGIDLIQLTIKADSLKFISEIKINSLPGESNDEITIYTFKDIFMCDGYSHQVFRIKDYDIVGNAGKVKIKYKIDSTSRYSDTIVVLQDLHTFYTDIGILFAYGKDGIIKGYPNVSLSAYSKQTNWATLFSELYFTAIAPVKDSAANIPSHKIFTEGGSILNLQVGTILYPWFKPWHQEYFGVFFSGGVRTFYSPDLIFKKRFGAGFTIDFFPLTGDFDNGFLDIAYFYDEFWKLSDSIASDPNRLNIKAHVDFVLPGVDKFSSLELLADLPVTNKGYGSLGVVFVIGVNLPQLLNNIYDSLFNVWGDAKK
ncbi:MAG: hypothetical protein IPM56_03085 [Ignavibacteriales bacterium]|nr:MAG: hypothetical protein IPM56_03085 [Ignavibacteriales bacterium]